MLKNYWTIAIRNLLKQRVYSFINLFGLAIGMAGFILTLLFVQNEFGYDRFHKHGDRIVRVVRETRSSGDVHYSLQTSGALAGALTQDLPEVETATRMWRYNTVLIHKGRVFRQRFYLIDRAFFDVFELPFLYGDPETCLDEPNSVVLTERMARKFFDDEHPMGKILTVDGRHWDGDFRVTGVLRDLPGNSSLEIDFLHSTVGNDGFVQYRWVNWSAVQSRSTIGTYALLKSDSQVDEVEAKLPDLMERYMGRKTRASNAYHLQPLTRTHLHTGVDYGIETEVTNRRHAQDNRAPRLQGDIRHVYLFTAAGLAVLAIACINFMNLSTARSMARAREVGTRKAVGAERTQLIGQFLSESVVIAFIALPLSILMTKMILPDLNGFIERDLSLSLTGDPRLLPALVLITLLVGLVSGSYPAFYLTRFQAGDILRGISVSGRRGAGPRMALVVAQFALSVLLVVSALTVWRQISFIREKELGFQRDHVVVVPIFVTFRESRAFDNERLAARYRVVKQAFLDHTNVLKATAYTFPVGMGLSNVRLVRAEGPGNDRIYMPLQQGDEDYLDTFGMELLAGRDFSADSESDQTEAVIINETAAKQLGWDDAVGKRFEVAFLGRKGRVIGVVKDYHYRSLRERIGPTGIYMRSPFYAYVALRIRSEGIGETVDYLEEVWDRFVPNRPFTFWFLDDQLDTMYREETRLAQLFSLFAVLAIFIACLGLFGLTAYTVEQRTKEIGVRKILGASSTNVVVTITKVFLRMVLWACLIAVPISYLLMERWLEDFAYRTDLSAAVFILSAGLAVGVALVTVATVAYKASIADPVVALRYE